MMIMLWQLVALNCLFIVVHAGSGPISHCFEAGSFAQYGGDIATSDSTHNTVSLVNDWSQFGSSITFLQDRRIAVGSKTEQSVGFRYGLVYILDLNADLSVAVETTIDPIGIAMGDLLPVDFGRAVEGLGDLDGDGWADLAISDLGGDNINDGRVFITYLNPDGSMNAYDILDHDTGGLTAYGHNLVADEYFGGSIANIGDLDGDSYPELIVTMGLLSPNERAVWLIFLDVPVTHESDVPGQTICKNAIRYAITSATHYQIAGDVTTVGTSDHSTVQSYTDFDNDGVMDVLFGEANDAFGANGKIFLTLLSTDNLFTPFKQVIRLDDITTEANLLYGAAITPIGDQNGDGVIDLMISAKNTFTNMPVAFYQLYMNSDFSIQFYRVTDAVSEHPFLFTDAKIRAVKYIPASVGGGPVFDYSLLLFGQPFAKSGDSCTEQSCGRVTIMSVLYCDCVGTGFTGVSCELDVDDCTPSPCLASEVCTDIGTYMYSCAEVDECLSNPCANGVCLDASLSYLCDCSGTGYTGVHCESDVDDCASFPCLNNGNCTDTGIDTFSCDCTDTGFHGMDCSSDVDDCASTPCQNGGVCSDLGVNAYTCDCSGTGFEGVDCSSDVDECMSSPCLNNGICTDAFGSGTFSCDCTGTGYEGGTCSADADECASTPCLNGGVCNDIGTFLFTCDCSSTQYFGSTCESFNGNLDGTGGLPSSSSTTTPSSSSQVPAKTTELGGSGSNETDGTLYIVIIVIGVVVVASVGFFFWSKSQKDKSTKVSNYFKNDLPKDEAKSSKDSVSLNIDDSDANTDNESANAVVPFVHVPVSDSDDDAKATDDDEPEIKPPPVVVVKPKPKKKLGKKRKSSKKKKKKLPV